MHIYVYLGICVHLCICVHMHMDTHHYGELHHIDQKYSIHFGASGTGVVRQSLVKWERPGSATRQGLGLTMSVSWIVHDSMVR